MRNVFIAVGGSGTKVAEALVRLLAIGFPTHREKGVLTSAGHSLEIWRLDPDLSSGAAVALDNCLRDYLQLQELLSSEKHATGIAGSQWAMDVDTNVKHLDPLQLPSKNNKDNNEKSLGGILDSQYGDIQRSLSFLAPFYEAKDLRVQIDRGFYQKPFIGAAVMAVFADSLRDERSPGGKKCGLTAFHNVQTNFFLCGSLHGGTGACGVPVLGEYLSGLKKKKENQSWDWQVGACLITPYCVPPQPPFGGLRSGQPTAQQISDLVKEHGDKPAFAGLTPEDKNKLVEQILLGFYAEPEAMEARARQGLAYYKDHASDYFDDLYLVGKPEPDKLKVWSNGGQSQRNPLNSAEIVAALAALNFFSRARTGSPDSYVIGASTADLDSKKMNLHQLPTYSVAGEEIDPERVFLSTAVMRHLLIHQIPWDVPARSFPDDIRKLKKVYENNEGRKSDDYSRFNSASALLNKFILATIHPQQTIGWSGEDANRIGPYLSHEDSDVKEITARTAKKFMKKEAKGELELGRSSIRVSTFEFGDWCPESADFTRGNYLRLVWSNLFARAQRRRPVEGNGNSNRKEFLNNGIVGGGAGIADKRGFRAVRTEYITSPDYDPKYFETFPTSWAAAYAFRKVLDLRDKPGMSDLSVEVVTQAIEEWVTLFLLHYFGVVYLAEYTESELLRKYDQDLWTALSLTYPSARDRAPKSIRLLQTRAGTVLGAYYPSVIFFPARDRTNWEKDETLEEYVRNQRLSWAASKRTLFLGEQEEKDFHTHLRLVAEHAIPIPTLKDVLHEFSLAEYRDRIDLSEAADKVGRDVLKQWSDPAVWKILGENKWTESELLDMYPLKAEKRKEKGDARPGRVFYMVTGLPATQWMKNAIRPGGPTPQQYRKLNDNQIVVELPGRKFTCTKEENDEIVILKDLFLKDAPHWCKVSKSSDEHTQRIKTLHRVGKLRNQVLLESEIAVCLAPIGRKFLRMFPSLLNRPENAISVEVNPDGESLTWVFKLLDKEIKWQTAPQFSKGITQSSFALWPPRVSSRWHLYAAYGVGGRQDSGRWNLVDENAEIGERFEVEENEEYISVLHGKSGQPNRPRALLLHDSGEQERGVLFLADLDQVDPTPSAEPTAVAVDFGTSNTCFAFDDGTRGILQFSLAPEVLWGKRADKKRLENPGFVPFLWGGAKGFFPTVLLSRISDQTLNDQLPAKDVTLQHLFKVDVPCLHRALEDRLFYGQLDKVWKIHPNLKWDLENKTEPWRTLFLQQTLLFTHAEMFFNRSRMIDRYVFTFPLAYGKDERERFHAKAMAAVQTIRHYCYGHDLDRELSYDELKQQLNYDDTVDESTAVAAAIRAPEGVSNMEVFVDVGGGTADIAIRHSGRFLVLESLKVAGNTFFNFAGANFKEAVCGGPEFRRHLGRLLQGKDGEVTLPHLNNSPDFRLNVFYSVAVNSLSDEEFRDREQSILKRGMGAKSYQKFRTKLFFRHLISYALLQSCAAIVDNKLKLTSGINLILGGNGWGLLVFAELPRQRARLEEEAREILKLLKGRLAKDLPKEMADCLSAVEKINVNLLNENDLSKAKTNVALGALNSDKRRRDTEKTAPYTGITFRDFRVHGKDPIGNGNSRDLHWWSRWGFQEMKERFGFMDAVKDISFESPENPEEPLDETLAIFSRVGSIRGYEQDTMPADIWNSINTAIMKSLRELNADRIDQAPINYFLSSVLYEEKSTRDFLDALAEANDHYKA